MNKLFNNKHNMVSRKTYIICYKNKKSETVPKVQISYSYRTEAAVWMKVVIHIW